VQGFGCRPYEMEPRAPGPASGSRQRTNPRVDWVSELPQTLWGFDRYGRCARASAVCFAAMNDAADREQQLRLMVETEVAGGYWKLASTPKQPDLLSVIVTGQRPATGKVGTWLSQRSDRGHEVSILMVTGGEDR